MVIKRKRTVSSVFLNTGILPLSLCALLCSQSANAYEAYISAGINHHKIKYDTRDASFDSKSPSDTSPYLGAGVLNQYGRSQKHLFGFGVDWHQLLGDSVIGLRALNYEYQLAKRVRLGGFFGAVDLDSGASQTGYYTGGHIKYQGLFKSLDLVLDFRVTDKLQRDMLLENDPEDSTNKRSDFFVSYSAVSFLVSWRFDG